MTFAQNRFRRFGSTVILGSCVLGYCIGWLGWVGTLFSVALQAAILFWTGVRTSEQDTSDSDSYKWKLGMCAWRKMWAFWALPLSITRLILTVDWDHLPQATLPYHRNLFVFLCTFCECRHFGTYSCHLCTHVRACFSDVSIKHWLNVFTVVSRLTITSLNNESTWRWGFCDGFCDCKTMF